MYLIRQKQQRSVSCDRNVIHNISFTKFMLWLYCFIALFLNIFLPCVHSISFFGSDSDIKVTVKSTGPVTLDTPIWFSAEIYPYEQGSYRYEWEDDSYPQNTFIDNDQGPRSQWSLIYNSSVFEIHTGYHTVTVKVYQDSLFHPFPVAENNVKFEVSDTINGKLSIVQPNVTILNPGYISTLNVTNITSIIHDPNNWMRNHTEEISFYWHITDKETGNVTMTGPCFTPSLLINITTPGDYFIRSSVILKLSDRPVIPPTTTTTTTTTTTPPSNTTLAPPNSTTTVSAPGATQPPAESSFYTCDGWWNGFQGRAPFRDLQKSFTKYGFFFSEIEAREPMHNFNLTGSTWIRHGVLLTLKVKCSGSGPFFYCFNITYGTFNKTDPIFCTDQSVATNVCGFSIQRYLSRTGTYTLSIRMYNDVSEKLLRMAINVYNVDRKPQLLHIIIPVSCSLVAIIIIIFGIAHFIQNKHRYSIEVADFDFCASEETDYKTFLAQLKEALSNAFSADIEPTYRSHRRGRNRVERPTILEDED